MLSNTKNNALSMRKAAEAEKHGKQHNKNDKNKTENTSVSGRKILSLWGANADAI